MQRSVTLLLILPCLSLGTVVERIMAIPDDQVPALVAQVRERFGGRHRDLEGVLVRHAALVHDRVGDRVLSPDRRLLLGAYFTQEYAIEAAALTNPSVVPARGASDAVDGDLPFVMSARAIGEGHVSSIVFRSGVVTADGDISIDPVSGHVVGARRQEPAYDRRIFVGQLLAAGADQNVVTGVMRSIPERFSMEELESWLRALTAHQSVDPATHEMVRLAHWLAEVNYVAVFPADSAIGERVGTNRG